MHKIVVYSHDKISALGISHLLFWEKYGYTVIGNVDDDAELKKLYKTEDPDIIIVDCDSLLNLFTLANINSYVGNRKVIVIGSKQKLVYEQLHSDKILDQIDKKLLTEELLLKKLSYYNDVLSENMDRTIDEKDRLNNEVKLFAQSHVLKEMFFGRRIGIELNNKVLKNYNISFPYDDFVVFTTNNSAILGVYKNSTIRFYQEICVTGGIVYICNTGKNELSFIYNFRYNDGSDFKFKVDRMGDRILSIMNKYYNVSNPVFISRPFKDLNLINRAYMECFTAFNLNRNTTSNLLVYCDSVEVEVDITNQVNFDNLLMEFRLALKERDQVQIKLTISSFIVELHKIEYINLSQLKYVLYSIIYLINDFISKIGYEKESIWSENFVPYTQIERLNSKNDFVELINFIGERVIILINNHEKSNVYITKMKSYAKTHYMEDIQMKDVSKEVELTTSYMSSMFKKHTGHTYKEYLIGCRLQKAKELLSKTNKQIRTIAQEIGYENEHYFSKIFKIKAGVTPSHYRNNHQKS